MRVLRALLCLLLVVHPADAAFRHGYIAPIVTTTFGLAADRADVPQTFASVAANATARREHTTSCDGSVSTLQSVDVGFDVFSSADARTIKRYIEYPLGTFTQITWSAATSVTITPGAVVKSDTIALAIPACTKFWERTVNLTATVNNFPVIQLPGVPTVMGVDDGISATDQGNSGTIAASSTQVNYFGASAILGTINAANARSFVIVGDSISWGFGDTLSGAHGGSGWPARMLDVHGYPYARINASGWTASSLAGSALAQTTAFVNVLTFTDAINELGVNDMAVNARTSAQVLADQQTAYGMFTGKRIYQSTITTETNSTDGWLTTGNQTFPASGTNTLGAQLNPLNTSIRALPAHVTAVLEIADAQMSARNSDLWTTSSGLTMTGDGIHPNATGANVYAAAVVGTI